jgi:beta-phosphoglucomutase
MNKSIPFPKAVLFDFDGVVVDSSEVHHKAWGKAFYEIFGNSIPKFPTKTHAGKAPILIAQYFCDYAKQSKKAQMLNDLKAKYLHASSNAPKLLPGIKELTTFLALNNIPFGIASNATRQFISNSIKQLELNFKTFTGVEDYKYPKPHPEAYLSLANRLNVSSKDLSKTWVLEDSSTGIMAAKEGNLIPIGIKSHLPESVLIKAGSLMQFNNPLEVFNYLTIQ